MKKTPEDVPPKKYKVISFDMDGVLLDSEDFSNGSWIHRMLTKTLHNLGITHTKENVEKLYISNILRNFEGICRDFGIKDPKKLWNTREKHFLKEKFKALREGEIAPFKDIEAIKDLNNHHKLTVVTNSPQSVADYFLEHFKLRKFFAVCIGRGSNMSSLYKMKPAPYLLNRMMDEVGSKRVLYVGDTDLDRRAAESAGIDFILLSRVDQKKGSFKNLWELKEYLQFQN